MLASATALRAHGCGGVTSSTAATAVAPPRGRAGFSRCGVHEAVQFARAPMSQRPLVRGTVALGAVAGGETGIEAPTARVGAVEGAEVRGVGAGGAGGLAQKSLGPATATMAKPVPEGFRRPKVIIAGGGIGGLMFALACQKRGVDVQLFEKVKQYKPFGGPIQLQCNALGALEAVDPATAAKVIARGTITGDRVNGLRDGIDRDWYYRFDTRGPCRRNGLPLTMVINRYELLDILVKATGAESSGVDGGTLPGSITTDSEVVRYEQDSKGVTVHLADGSTHRADVLIAADGIRSKTRKQMRGFLDGEDGGVTYSGYTVYTATVKHEADYVNSIGYQVFLGDNRYFVVSDIGEGRQQFYAFEKVPAGSNTEVMADENMKDHLLELFKEFCVDVQDTLNATRPEDIERRDVYDRRPILKWADGRVALLGDAAHAVQPNMGQGGCQAIEDAYALATILADKKVGLEGTPNEGKGDSMTLALIEYNTRRYLRAGAIHGFSRFAVIANDLYRPYLGSYPYNFYPEPVKRFWHKVAELKIPHPGKVFGQIAMMCTMNLILEYIGSGAGLPDFLGGSSRGQKDRVQYCQVPGVSAPIRECTDEDFKMKGFPGFQE